MTDPADAIRVYSWNCGLEQIPADTKYGRIAREANDMIQSLVAERDEARRVMSSREEWLEGKLTDAEAEVARLKGALGEAAVHITISRAVRHQISTGDDCPYCKLDQEMLDTIGAALAAEETTA